MKAVEPNFSVEGWSRSLKENVLAFKLHLFLQMSLALLVVWPDRPLAAMLPRVEPALQFQIDIL